MTHRALLFGTLFAAALGAAGPAAHALPTAPLPLATPANPAVVEVYGGCGVYGHRGPYGGCRPGGQAGGYRRWSCPRGFHVGPYGRHCWPN